MGIKAEIVSRETVKPSSPTPHHLRDFKLCLLDGMAPFCYVPIVIFYSASDVKTFGNDFKLVSAELKKSLSDTLPLYYPFAGRMKGSSLVECNDAGVAYSEAKVPFKQSDFLPNVQVSQLNDFLPFDPYHFEEDAGNMAIQVTEFSCGGIAIGLCITHLITDAATAFSFLNAWGATARGVAKVAAPHMEAASIFPPGHLGFDLSECMLVGTNVVTKRFIFDSAHLSELRAKLADVNPTRVETVIALTWKAAIEAARAATSSEEQASKTRTGMSVNVRKRMAPPLPDNSFGNLWVPTITPFIDLNEKVELKDYVKLVREMIRRVDGDYVRMFEGENAAGISELLETLNEAKTMMTSGACPIYIYSSWLGFPLYETDYGWGKPTWVSTLGVPSKWCVYLLPTRTEDGIEAWVNLSEEDMQQFELHPELLQFASPA